MASKFHPLSVNLYLLSITIIILSMLSLLGVVNSSISAQELESMLSSLRSHNYNLFSNAITTSDILYDIHVSNTTTRSITFFAPSDSALFALDMTSTALLYTQTLRYHIVPRRFSISDLRRLPYTRSSLHTLLPLRDIHVSRRRSPRFEIFAVNGVDVVVPGLFYGHTVAVHGLDGILSFRSPVLRYSPANPTILRDPLSNLTPVDNRTVFRPLPKLPLVNFTISPTMPKFLPANRTVSPRLPEPPTVDRVSPSHSPENALGPGHLLQSPMPLVPEVSKLPAHLPDVAINPGHLLHSPAPLIPEVASTPMNGSVADPQGNTGPVRSEKKFLEINEVSITGITTDAAVLEEAGEFLRIKRTLKDEMEAETVAMAPGGSWLSDEGQTIENQVTGGELMMDHVIVHAGQEL